MLLAGLKKSRSESNRSPKDQLATCRRRVTAEDHARDGICDFRIAEARPSRKETSVFEKWVDAQEIRMVQDVERRRAELEGRALTQLYFLGNRQVGDVGHVSLRYVSWRVAERSPKDPLRRSAVDDVTDLVAGYVHRIPGGVDGVEADQLSSIGAGGGNRVPGSVSTYGKEIARIAQENAHVRDRSAGTAQERTSRIEASIERCKKLAVKEVT